MSKELFVGIDLPKVLERTILKKAS